MIIFYKTVPGPIFGKCLTVCKIKGGGVMAGSAWCDDCENFKGKGKFLFFKYVKCEGKI